MKPRGAIKDTALFRSDVNKVLAIENKNIRHKHLSNEKMMSSKC